MIRSTTYVPFSAASDSLESRSSGVSGNEVSSVVSLTVSDVVQPFTAIVDCHRGVCESTSRECKKGIVSSVLARLHSPPIVRPKALVEMFMFSAQ